MLAVPNKELRGVVRTALRNGWQQQRGGNKACHTWIAHPDGHRIPIASSPSDKNAAFHVKRRIRHCEEGRCRCIGVTRTTNHTKGTA